MSGAVVLLHSTGMSARQWKRLAAALEQRGERVLSPDFIGHGSSPPVEVPQPLSFRDDVERVRALLPEDGAHLVGHSYGGFVALLVALAEAREPPGRVRSVAVYDPVAFGTLDRAEDAPFHAAVEQVARVWDAARPDAWLEAFVDYWGGAGAWSALREEMRAEFRRVAWAAYQGVASLVRDTTRAESYAVIAAPVLLVTGERSPASARTVVARLAAAIPRARVEVVAGAGHMGPLTHAEALNAVILRWVSEA